MDKKLYRLNVRVTKTERAAIQRRASELGISVSEYIRRATLSDSDRPVIRTDHNTLKALYSNMRKAGSNLNQITREINSRHNIKSRIPELKTSIDALSKACEDVSRFILDARHSL